MKLSEKIINFYSKHKVLLIIILLSIICLGIVVQGYLFFNENMSEKDIIIESIGWSEKCENNEYTPIQKEQFCNECNDLGGTKCNWPLDLNLRFNNVKKTLKTGGEVHCLIIIDDVNYYTEYGKYFGITNNTLFTWEVIDASKSHNISFCCGIARESVITTLTNIEKQWPQVCAKASVTPRCTINDFSIQQ